MLINQPTDGATRGLTLRVRLLGHIKKKNYNFFFIWPKNFNAQVNARRFWTFRGLAGQSRMVSAVSDGTFRSDTVLAVSDDTRCLHANHFRTSRRIQIYPSIVKNNDKSA